MKKVVKILLPHAVVFTVLFVILPLILKFTVDGYKSKDTILLLLFAINPAAVVILGAIFGTLNGFKLYYPIIAPLLFILSMWILYNSSILFYVATYFVLSLIGMFIGSLFYYISGKHKSGSEAQ